MEGNKHGLQVEIWSDIMCPFCFLGKHNFLKGLDRFEHKSEVDLVWKSFQLMPGIETQPGRDLNNFLAETKGIGEEHARQMHQQLAERGREAGIEYRFDRVVVANTRRAHVFLQFAGENGKQTEAQSLLFEAYFRDGKNIDDEAVISQLAQELELGDSWAERTDKKSLLEKVKEDMQEARDLGVQGVPFFLFDGKYAVSGAREPEVFLKALQQSYDAASLER